MDLHMLQEIANKADVDEKQRQIVEKSSLYLGYKLLWVLQLFINGKKFPSGHIPESKWRAYVHDIVSFLSSPQIMRDLMLIDPETLF